MSDRFELPHFDTCDKDLSLYTRDIELSVDFDDVNHYVVEELVRLIVPVLNAIPKAEWDAAVARGMAKLENENE